MHIHCELVILILALTLDDQVHTGKIYGGHEAKPHSRPYMVLVERTTPDGNKKYCGGFLLNEDFVMTAAHCDANRYQVLLGLHDYNGKENIQNIPVSKSFPRTDYDAIHLENDLMLLKLNSKAKFSNDVKPITLADRKDSPPKECIVCGWGSFDRKSKHMSRVLREINVTVIDNKSCEEDNSYCSEGENGPGEGDSGGPLVCGDGDGKAYGVVSAVSVAIPGGAKVYHFAKIPDYRDWIDSTMKNN